jgi:glycyl-tRNA synthetase beta subunit
VDAAKGVPAGNRHPFAVKKANFGILFIHMGKNLHIRRNHLEHLGRPVPLLMSR